MAAPSLQEIKELKTYLVNRFAKQKRQIQDASDLRHLAHTDLIPEQYKTSAHEVKTSYLSDYDQRLKSTLSANPPTWRSTPLGEGTAAKETASRREKWLAAAHAQMEADNSRRTHRMLISSAVGDGMGVDQIRYLPTAYPRMQRNKEELAAGPEGSKAFSKRVEERYRTAAFPFAWRQIDPLSYHYYDDGNGDTTVMLIEKKPKLPTLAALGVKLDRAIPNNESSTGDECESVEVWKKDSVVYLVDDEIKKTVNHGWGRQSIWHFAGLSSHENMPEYEFLPVAHAFQHLIPLLDRLLTMKTNWAYLSSFPTPVLKLAKMRGEILAADGIEPVNLGELQLLFQDESLSFLPPPPIGADLNQLIQLVMQMIESAGMSNMLKGQTSGDPSGYLANQMITAAKLTYDPIIDNYRFAAQRRAAFILWMIDNVIKRPVYVEAEGAFLSLGPKDINGYYKMECRLDALLPSNFIMEGRFGLEQANGGAISMYTHRDKYLHLEHPEEEDKLKLAEDFMNSQQMHDYLMQKIAEKNNMLPKAAPAPTGLVGPKGEPLPPSAPGSPLGNTGLPVTPGQGMPMAPDPRQLNGPMQAMPQVNGGIPGAPQTMLPGGATNG